MEDPITIKPIFWRLVMWKFVPIYIGFLLGMLINSLKKGYLDFPFLQAAIGSLPIIIIFSVIFRKKYEIVISEGKIGGPSAGIVLDREAFPLEEIDLSQLHKQTFYEKVSLFRTIRSINQQKIMVTDFIYEKASVRILFEMLEKRSA